jgi:two-component system phosphate regulon sensor histidine kinase PhoR
LGLPYVLLVLAAMAGLGVYLTQALRQAYLDDLRTRLAGEAKLVAVGWQEALTANRPPEQYQLLAQSYAELLGARVTLIDTDGTVLADTEEDPAGMESHRFRPEVRRAYAIGEGSDIRRSRTMDEETMYVAALVKVDLQVRGVARVALPLSRMAVDLGRLRLAVTAALALAALATLALTWALGAHLLRPLRQLTASAGRIAAGDLDEHLLTDRRDEIGALVEAFHRMAEQLQTRFGQLTHEQERLAAILQHMADGVLITDSEGRVLLLNPASSRLLEISQEDALNRTLAQVARQHQIIELWQRCRERSEEQSDAFEIGRKRLLVQAVVTPLKEAESAGFLIILQDLTQIRRLETVRRDFISNISHELRTPLAALKALVDTLRDGALDDPPAAQRFLGRMDAEVDTMTQMVQELLELSRIESGQAPMRLRVTEIREVVSAAVERLRPQAERAALKLDITLPSEPTYALADPERIRQVVMNLLHNALKFTPADGQVQVSVAVDAEDDEVIVSVRDSGIGIPAESMPRIFERFYKADPARATGGTGLGLAIAKHIVQGHGGRIWAESIEGKGSVFHFTLLLASAR